MGETLRDSSTGTGRRLGRARRRAVVAVAAALGLAAGPGAHAAAETPSGPETVAVPATALDVYRWAADGASCALDWPVLAGLAAVGSDHGRVGGATTDRTGRVTPEILGAPLDGRDGRRLVSDTDDGLLDGDPELDRALGPFQFIPTTWLAVATDGNGDGYADPHNLWDAAASAAVLLCGEDATSTERASASWYRSDRFTDLVDNAAQAAEADDRPRTGPTRPTEFGLLLLGTDGRILRIEAGRPVPAPPSANSAEAAVETTATIETTAEGSTTPSPSATNVNRLDLFRSGRLPLTADTLLVGDWDGDGTDEPTPAAAVLDPALLAPTETDEASTQPVVGDWDGDGDDDAGVFEDGVFHLWIDDDVRRIDPSLDELDPDATGSPAESLALAGDWDGDGADELAVAMAHGEGGEARVVFVRTGFATGDPGERYGRSLIVETGDQLLTGDLDGDGVDTVLSVHRTPVGIEVIAHDDGESSRSIVPLDDLVLDPGEAAVGLVTGTWPVAASAAPSADLGASLATLPDPTFWLDATAADGTELSLWWVGHEGHRIAVTEDRVVQTQAMIAAAAADGVELKGWGWRSFERQIELRAAHCADIWTTPPSECSPPTAIPGHSRHEFGLAIDFSDGTNAIGPDSPEFAWLSEHAADFGYFNLPSESWHWSIDGG